METTQQSNLSKTSSKKARTLSQRHMNLSDDTFSSGISSDLDSSELDSLDGHIQRDAHEHDKVLGQIGQNLFREIQTIKTGKTVDKAPNEIFRVFKGGRYDRETDPIYRRNQHKQRILHNARSMIEKIVQEKADDEGSIESISLDGSDEEQDLSNLNNNPETKYQNVSLHTKHGEIELPQGLLHLGIEKIFTKEMTGKITEQFTPEDIQRLSSVAGKPIKLEEVLDDLQKFATDKANNVKDKTIFGNPFEIIEKFTLENKYTKKELRIQKYQKCAGILRRKKQVEEMIAYLESNPSIPVLQDESEDDSALTDEAQFENLPAAEFAQKVLLDPLSDEEPSTSANADRSRRDLFDYDPLNILVKRLHRQEAALDREERQKQEERMLKEKKIQENLEAEIIEENKSQKDLKALDWKDNVYDEVSNDLRQKCLERLKKNDDLNWISYSDRFSNPRTIKNLQTIRKPSKAWFECYSLQEAERYKYPTKPWVYYNPDETTSIVAPVLRKMGQATNKAREHNALKGDRPPIVTILCLVRDAAARLPDGVGTRADICTLLRCSQYFEQKSSDAQINTVVSGALDRLHYETDPCVKYDSEKRLWIYLHKNRQINYPLWGSQNPNEPPNTIENNSYKPEYFFERNLPAFESDEEIQMLKGKPNESVQGSNPYQQELPSEHISQEGLDAPMLDRNDFNSFEQGNFKRPKLD
ncbi:unnamed protein product [Moneuplotes crassus]|uniref:Nuclear factor related to kappa-B-binding protein second winged helix domain-containing protein n=2 Tax=Euplotes crassus TaxID=5936 RepID=A0AAD1U5M4_EUPCR|nr:unnamed protein product [Moneuplotes crassus]